VAQQPLLFFILPIQSRSEKRFLCLPQQLLQGSQQAAGAGAQQLGAAGAAQVGAQAAGAQAAGAAQVGAAAGAQQLGAAAGAAQVGSGAQQLGAGAQQLFFLLNRPASALFRLAKHTSAAVIHANFISSFS